MGVVHIGALHLPVDGNHNGQGDGRFGRRNGNDENDENRTGQAAPTPVLGEGKVIDVHGVEHQLDSHEDRDGVLPDQNTEEADPEKDRGQVEKMDNGDFAHDGSFRATTTAPTNADSSRTETNSKAKANPFCGFRSPPASKATSST